MRKPRVISGVVGLTILGIFLVVAISLVLLATSATDRDLTVTFLNVGQGDATLIETPSGTQVLIDGGQPRSVNRPLSRHLPFYDRTLDVVIATHADTDHIGGLVEVLADYRVGRVGLPSLPGQAAAFQAFQQAVGDEQEYDKAITQKLTRGDVIHLDEGAYLLTLFPLAGHQPTDLNESSTVFKLIYGNTSFILTGDSGKAIEEYLAALDGGLLDADVLKLGHHGSDTSSSRIFLSAVSPEIAVISAGADNSYGHPHQSVLNRLSALGIEAVCTCKEGDVGFVSDGIEVRRSQ
ncbi:MAG: MBL fold metallo-hydrolase [Candidatus Paceibacterota bacterium]